MKKGFLFLVVLFELSIQIAAGQDFTLQLPVKCNIGNDCWLINYVDNDSSENWQDYSGGQRTYDGHRGTDIAIQNLTEMGKGVDVLAAANGVVIAVRDSVPDVNALVNPRPDLEKIGCGNRVAIAHRDGWITDYCHMKNGSITVKKGNRVKAGQKIGEIGLSGLTEFPHLHFGVMKQDLFFDPFTGQPRYRMEQPFYPLWHADVLDCFKKSVKILYNVGVSQKIPDWISIRDSNLSKTRFDVQSDMILIWADLVHVEKGDILNFYILGPGKTPFLNQRIEIKKSNVKKYLYIGKKKPSEGFETGTYKGIIKFMRPSTGDTDKQTIEFTMRFI